MTNFSYEKHGVNLVSFHNESKEIHVTLEYNPETGKFKAYSDYDMTKTFIYHGRTYDRTKSGNNEIYRKVIRMVHPFLKEAYIHYFI